MRKNIFKYLFAVWGIAAVAAVAVTAAIILRDTDIRTFLFGGDPGIYEAEDDDDSEALVSGMCCYAAEEYRVMNEERKTAISCWGDSMMAGYGIGPAVISVDGQNKDISFYNAPYTIGELTSIQTYNLGISGDNSYDIALRAGGIPIYTDRDLYINNHKDTLVSFVDENGDTVYMEDYSGYGTEDNDYPDTVIIGGRLCKIRRSRRGRLFISLCSDSEEYGTEGIYVPAGALVVPKAAFDHKNDILVLEIGSNGGWDGDYGLLISQYQGIIDFCASETYIIVGDTDDPGTSLGDTGQDMTDEYGEYIGISDTNWEAALREAFGDHFLNMRTYMIENGLSDCGLTATQEDILLAEMGCISPQLRDDWTHFNSYGYYSKGMAIYLKGIELGYWQKAEK